MSNKSSQFQCFSCVGEGRCLPQYSLWPSYSTSTFPCYSHNTFTYTGIIFITFDCQFGKKKQQFNNNFLSSCFRMTHFHSNFFSSMWNLNESFPHFLISIYGKKFCLRHFINWKNSSLTTRCSTEILCRTKNGHFSFRTGKNRQFFTSVFFAFVFFFHPFFPVSPWM